VRDIEQLISGRRSIRTFSDRKLPADMGSQIEQLSSSLVEEDSSIFSIPIQLQLLSKELIKEKRLGTYGIIRNAQGFLTGLCDRGEDAVLSFGYTVEKILIHLRDQGIETCWLGGTFNRGAFAKLLRSEQQIIPAVLPLGYAAQKQAVPDRLLRRAAGSDKRLDMSEIFSFGSWGTPFLRRDDSDLFDALEAVRAAPSAGNKQPWRVLVSSGKNCLHLFLSESAGYRRAVGYPMQMLDMGIAMSHLYLFLRARGEDPLWYRDQEIETQRFRYIASLKRG
jgi:nitroreductase